MFYETLFAFVPVEIARNHVVLNLALVVVVVLLLLCRLKGSVTDLCEEIVGICALDLGVDFLFWFGNFVFVSFLGAYRKLSSFACVFFNLFHYLFLVETQIIEDATVSLVGILGFDQVRNF